MEKQASLCYLERDRNSISAIQYKKFRVLGIARSVSLLEDRTEDFFARLFPELFPFGEGYANTDRDIKVSAEQYVSHYLQLSQRRFSTHPSFTLISFDIISRRRDLMATTISCKIHQQDDLAIASVTSKQLSEKPSRTVAKRKKIQNSTFKANEQPRNILRTSDNTDNARKLLAKVNIASGSYYYTNQERALYQRKSWSLSTRIHGAALFITITPDDYNSLLLC